MTMDFQPFIARWLHVAVTALGSFLILHGTMTPGVAAMLSQLIVGAVLILGASAFHSLRIWVDKSNPAIAPFVDQIDGALGAASTTTQASVSTTTVTASVTPTAPVAASVERSVGSAGQTFT